MTTTPNLPPLPDEDGYILIYIAGRPVEVNGYRNSTMEAYALAAYQAGRDAALNEAANIAMEGPITNKMVDDDNAKALAWHTAARIRRLKSDTKEGV